MTSQIHTLVLTGFGLNCDLETTYSLEKAGAKVDRIHLNELIADSSCIDKYKIFVIGGGFSWGDDHGAGVIMGMKIKNRLQDALFNFIQKDGIVIGICNGFQILVNLGLLPGFTTGKLRREVALIANDCGNFRDQWVTLKANPLSPCVLTKGIDVIDLPIRHGEGKFYATASILDRLQNQQQIAFTYVWPDGTSANGAFPHNPNGSLYDIASICDPTGRIVGMMPHPEAYNHFTNHPDWTLLKEQCKRSGTISPIEGLGVKIFRNAVQYFS